MTAATGKLIHLARYQSKNGTVYLFLRQVDPRQYAWYERQADGSEKETDVSGETVEEAIRLANRKWRKEGFRTVICGFRYTLPERDEHGCNALFYQMAAGYATPRGVYFDEELGHNCFIQNASDEAVQWLARLKQEGKLEVQK